MSEAFVRAHLNRLEDFWRRRESATTHTLRYSAYGYSIRFAANDPILLNAAHISAQRYSRCKPIPNARSIALTFVVDPHMAETPVPLDWPARLRYMAVGPWLTINAEPWVNAFANLQAWTGVALVSPTLARVPHLLSRYVGDSFVLNMLMRTGWGQLHASCLYRDRRALLLSGPHNAGKSTTALRLVLAGYQLLSDGMTYVRLVGPEVELLGYPVGEVKLRTDVLDAFPPLRERGRVALVRDDTKVVLDLRREMPARVVEEAVHPEEVVLCLLERTGKQDTVVRPVTREEALVSLFPEATYLDDMAVMAGTITTIRAFLEKVRCYRLELGLDGDEMVQRVNSLF